MSIIRLLAIALILVATTVAWVVLGAAIQSRTHRAAESLDGQVADSWGPVMSQQHPLAYYVSPTAAQGRRELQPERSDVRVKLAYEPKKKGLIWYRTYVVDFEGDYTITNPTPITQTIYVAFKFPAEGTSYYEFSLRLGDQVSTNKAPVGGGITEAVILKPHESVPLRVAYRSRGMDRWGYTFSDNSRIRAFDLAMTTDFGEIDFPPPAGSPTDRARSGAGWELAWSYPDVIAAQPIAMAMPKVLNPGPVAARITYFAPTSLLFFFAVLLIVGTVRGVNLHPMNYFFLAAGFFAFQLLFAYLVDLVNLHAAFAIAAAVSLALVSGYIWAAVGWKFARLAALAQFAYMVLFSYSFFFDGLTGLTITIGAVITLALLMAVTARVNWSEKLAISARLPAFGTPPPIPPQA